MADFKLTTPVAFIIFNRPDTTARVFAEIAKAKPPKLLVVGDGPRASRPGEAERVAATRAIIEQVNWPCEVLVNFSDINLGCKNRVASGIDWVFDQVPEAIILEDDCLPHPTFFQYCQELLERYRDDDRIAVISGDNLLLDSVVISDSYYFSKYSFIWGWASWRRVWKTYDRTAALWPRFRDEGWLEGLIKDPAERSFWHSAFDGVHSGRVDTWDHQLTLSNWAQGRLSIAPARNLISNIGFGAGATHTTDAASSYADLPVDALHFPMKHPEIMARNTRADSFIASRAYSLPVTGRPEGVEESVVKKVLGESPVFLMAPLSQSGSILGPYITSINKNVLAAIDDASSDERIHGVPRWSSKEFLTHAGQYPDALAVDFSVSPRGKEWVAGLCNETGVRSVGADAFFDSTAHQMQMLAIETFELKPHLETAGEVLLDGLQAGRTGFSFVGGGLPFQEYEIPSPQPHDFWAPKVSRVRRFEKILASKGVSVLDCPEVPLAMLRQIRKWAESFEGDLAALKKYAYKEHTFGLAVASTLISKYRNPNIDTRELAEEIKFALEAAALVYERALRLIALHKPKSVLTFNGRFARCYPIVKAAHNSKVKLLLHERGCDYKKYEIYHESVHSVAQQRKLIDRHWSSATDREAARAIGADYFQRRRDGEGIGWTSFTTKQVKGQSVPGDGRKRVVYFSSSDDEYAAVEDGVRHAFSPSGQKEAVQRLINICKRMADTELIIRVHPNVAACHASEQAWWNALAQQGVQILDPASTVDSYALAETADVVCSYGSTIGVEAAYWGTPSILLGDAAYAGFGCCSEPKDDVELERLLRQPPAKREHEGCLMFGYYFATFGKSYKYYSPRNLFQGGIFGDDLAW